MDVVQLLLAAGAPLEAKDGTGLTALQVGVRRRSGWEWCRQVTLEFWVCACVCVCWGGGATVSQAAERSTEPPLHTSFTGVKIRSTACRRCL